MLTGYAPEKIQYGINRYKGEVRRLYRTMETQLNETKSGFLVGDRCTIADISCWGWVAASSKRPLLPPGNISERVCADNQRQSGRVLISTSSRRSRSGCLSSSSAPASRRDAMCPRSMARWISTA